MSGWLQRSPFPLSRVGDYGIKDSTALPPPTPFPAGPDPRRSPEGRRGPGAGRCGNTHWLAVADNTAHHPERLPQVRVPSLVQGIEATPEGTACGDHPKPHPPPPPVSSGIGTLGLRPLPLPVPVPLSVNPGRAAAERAEGCRRAGQGRGCRRQGGQRTERDARSEGAARTGQGVPAR